MECEYCKKVFSTIRVKTVHQQSTKSCIALQQHMGVPIKKLSFPCQMCQKEFTTKLSLQYHSKICRKKDESLEKQIEQLQSVILLKDKEINDLVQLNAKQSAEIKKLKEQNNALKQRGFQPKQKESLETQKKEHASKPNSDIHEFTFNYARVAIRSDGMINATALCAAGNKLIGHYLENKQTKAYLEAVELDMGIPISRLLESNIGGHKGTWVHRNIGYHLAQWISPQFAVKVSKILDDFLHNELTSTINQLTEQNHDLKKLMECQKPHASKANSDIHKFTFNDTIVAIRSDGMINATALCAAGNKLIADYLRLSNTKAYLEEIETNMGIPILELIKVNIGGHKGTWVHRKIGYHLAQWISPQFAVKVSTILDELFVTGSVILGKEKSSNEIEIAYQNQVKDLKDQLDQKNTEFYALLGKHNATLKNHRYVKFKEKGPCFYIIESGLPYLDGIERKKFGIAGTTDHDTIDDRLKCHRTLWPQLKVDYILFIKEIDVIENSIKRLFKTEINPNGHEIIEGVSTETLIDSIHKIIHVLGIEDYLVLSNEKLKEYNDYAGSTVK
jgi:hypothetical protein